jgi:hypothetical protein
MSLKAKGKGNSQWKGDDVRYAALHEWVRKNFGQPETCEDCKTSGLKGKKIHWANVSGRYLRLRRDWKRLCVKCHSKFSKGKAVTVRVNGDSRIREIKTARI